MKGLPLGGSSDSYELHCEQGPLDAGLSATEVHSSEGYLLPKKLTVSLLDRSSEVPGTE
jgi:hypothetical protein